MSDPFAKFAQRKAQTISEIEERRRAEAEKLRAQCEEYPRNHNKILDRLKEFNPEPVIWRLYDVGFKSHPGFNSSIRREVSGVVLSEDGNVVREAYHDTTCRPPAMASDVFTAIKALAPISGFEYLEEWRRGQRYKGKFRIFTTGVRWQFILKYVLVENNDYDYTSREEVPLDIVIEVLPDKLVVGDCNVQPMTSDNFARILADEIEKIPGYHDHDPGKLE